MFLGHHEISIMIISKFRRNPYLLATILSVLIFFIFRIPYRNYIYLNKINDFFIADVAPNFLGVFVLVYYYKWTAKDNLNSLFICSAVFVGLSFYEIFIQKFMISQTIDFLDVIASLLGSICCYFSCVLIDKTLK
jgi:putative effector of murein hydrolase